MKSPNTKNYLLGKGVVYFDPFDSNGAKLGEIDLGNAPAFTVNLEEEVLEHYSSRSGVRKLDKKVALSQKVTGTFSLDELTLINLGLAFKADATTLTQTAGHQDDYSITIHNLDCWYDLGHRSLDLDPNPVVVTDEAGLVTYTEGVDYEIDDVTGRIFFHKGVTIAADDIILATYDYADLSMEGIQLAKNANVEGQLRFIGDPDVGPANELILWKASLSISAETGFITDDWATLELTFEGLEDETGHPDDPSGVIYLRAEGA